MQGLELQLVDWAVVAGYISAIMMIGIWAGRNTRSTQDYFFAGQRFSWWLAAVSCIATLVGSYSFQQYSETAYKYGFCSMSAYTNEWFVMPLFLLGWLPLVYYTRVRSIPEYFERRFDRRTRVAVLLTLMVYLIVYIGINLLTIGLLLDSLHPLGPDFAALIERLVPAAPNKTWVASPQTGIVLWAGLMALITAVYMHSGGQNTVMLTDFVQGSFLMLIGLALFGFGLYELGGFGALWEALPRTSRTPLAPLNHPPGLNAIGDFWSDGITGTFAFWMINQGILMRFLSVRNVREARRAMVIVVLLFMPLAAVAVTGAGIVGRAMLTQDEQKAAAAGDLAATGAGASGAGGVAGKAVAALANDDASAKRVFLVVSRRLFSWPGNYGLALAAVIAALLSTVDTYVTAFASIAVNDIWRPLYPGKPDAAYLNAARWTAGAGAGVGLLIVPVFNHFDSIYQALSFATSALNPPLVVVICLGMCWAKFGARAAFWTMVLGDVAMVASVWKPGLVTPFAQGMSPENGYPYIRALYGLSVASVLALVLHRMEMSPALDSPPKRRLAWILLLATMALVVGLAPTIDTSSNAQPPGLQAFVPGMLNVAQFVPLLVVAVVAGVGISRFETGTARTAPPGLNLTTLDIAKAHYKGGIPNEADEGRCLVLRLSVSEKPLLAAPQASGEIEHHTHADHADGEPNVVCLSQRQLDELSARPGDLVYVSDTRWWLGGFRSLHSRLGQPVEEDGALVVSPQTLDRGNLSPDLPVRIEKIM